MCYLRAEITTPSPEHERDKTIIARLVEIYAVHKRIPLNGYGSTTFRRQALERGAEPDECYVLGTALEEIPDIVIEVVVSSGGIDKLSVYQGLGVPGVWFFHKGRFLLFRLGDDGYAPIAPRVNMM